MNSDAPPRASRPEKPDALPELDDEQRAVREAENGLRQYDRMLQLIDAALGSTRPFRLRPSVLLELQRIAVENLVESAGVFRQGRVSITGTEHQPPPPSEVAALIDEMCEYVTDNWSRTPVHLSAYLMWRLNWIHPFEDGNGRTSRAVSYLVLCARLGQQLPGAKTIPERISERKQPYYAALDAADAAFLAGEVDVSVMEDLLAQHLRDQLVDTFKAATGR